MFLFYFVLIFFLLAYTQNWQSTNDFLEDLHRGGAQIISTQRIGEDFFLNFPHLLTFLKSPPGPSAGARPSWLFIINNKSPSSPPSSRHHRHQNRHNNNHKIIIINENLKRRRSHCVVWGREGLWNIFSIILFFILINTCHSHGRYLFTIFLYCYLCKIFLYLCTWREGVFCADFISRPLESWKVTVSHLLSLSLSLSLSNVQHCFRTPCPPCPSYYFYPSCPQSPPCPPSSSSSPSCSSFSSSPSWSCSPSLYSSATSSAHIAKNLFYTCITTLLWSNKHWNLEEKVSFFFFSEMQKHLKNREVRIDMCHKELWMQSFNCQILWLK